MYLQTPMEIQVCMWIAVHLIPEAFMEIYHLYTKIHKTHYGLLHAGRLVIYLLQKRLVTCRYIECAHTPDIWRHIHIPVIFTLVVDNFGVKVMGLEHSRHLVESLDFL